MTRDRDDGGGMPLFWLLCDGKDPTRIGSGLRVEIEKLYAGFAWIRRPRRVEAQLFLGLFSAPDLVRARAVALLVATLGDAVTRVWAAEEVLDPGEAETPAV